MFSNLLPADEKQKYNLRARFHKTPDSIKIETHGEIKGYFPELRTDHTIKPNTGFFVVVESPKFEHIPKAKLLVEINGFEGEIFNVYEQRVVSAILNPGLTLCYTMPWIFCSDVGPGWFRPVWVETCASCDKIGSCQKMTP
jgi:hypothetical protein